MLNPKKNKPSHERQGVIWNSTKFRSTQTIYASGIRFVAQFETAETVSCYSFFYVWKGLLISGSSVYRFNTKIGTRAQGPWSTPGPCREGTLQPCNRPRGKPLQRGEDKRRDLLAVTASACSHARCFCPVSSFHKLRSTVSHSQHRMAL